MNLDADAFEYRVCNRPGIEPSAGLRARVLQSAAAELSKSTPAAIAHPGRSRYWTAAAVALVAMNLSAICGSSDAFSLTRLGTPKQAVAELKSLRQLEAQQEGWLK